MIRPDSDVGFIRSPSGWRPPQSRGSASVSPLPLQPIRLFDEHRIDTGGYTIQGRSLDLNPAKAIPQNSVMPFVRVFGRVRIYPDYVVQPVTRFDAADPTKMRVQMLLCLGVGDLILYQWRYPGWQYASFNATDSAAPITAGRGRFR